MWRLTMFHVYMVCARKNLFHVLIWEVHEKKLVICIREKFRYSWKIVPTITVTFESLKKRVKSTGVARILRWGGLRTEAPNSASMWGGGIPLPSRLGRLRERRKLPQQGLAENGFWCILSLRKTNLVTTNLIFLLFC